MNRVVFASLTILFLLSVSSITGLIQVVKADGGTIYINADGSISPSTAPIYTADNITYTLTGNITAVADGIVIERDNIVLDGAGYTTKSGSRNELTSGIGLGTSNVTVRNMMITNFWYGIWLNSSSNNTFSGNNIANNEVGINLESSSNNTLSGNNVTANSLNGIWLESSSDSNVLSGNNVANNLDGIGLDSTSSNNTLSGNNVRANNYFGIWLNSSSNNNALFGNNVTANNASGILLDYYSDNNTFSGNNIANNGVGVYLSASSNNDIFHNSFVNNTSQVTSYDSTNVWDDGYPSGGNYWSDYAGVDLYSGVYQNATGTDGIGDTPYLIYPRIGVLNSDRYPLMRLFDPQTQDLAVAIRNLWLEYNSLNQTTQNELANVKNTLYVFITITAILAVALAYVATRKRKTKPET